MSASLPDSPPPARSPETTMRALLEAIPDLLLRVYQDGTFLNATAASAFARQLEVNPVSPNLRAMLPRPVAQQLLSAINKVLKNQTAEVCSYTVPVGDSLRAYETRVVATGSDEVALIVRDITAQQHAEERLAYERARLARRVEERTAELRAANGALARAARSKDEFLASMSHELRTPLNAILGLSEALQEEVYGPIGEQQARALRSIEESGRHLLSLINDILELSKIEAGKLELQIDQVSIKSVCQTSLRFIEQSAHKKRLRLVTHFDDQVTLIRADERRLKQMLVNLLSNAVKFTPEQGSIGLEVSADPDGGAVRCTVWDTGIGIAEEDMAQLFQPFVQLDSSLTRHHAGTGLGLALVYRMVQLHGGSVSATSVPGKGSRFTLSLPWSPADSLLDEALPRFDQCPQIVPQRVLLVEDSASTAEQLTRYLKELGVEVFVHPRGEGAVEQAANLRPDALILDIQLPGKSRWDVLAALKAAPQTAAIPVLIISVVDQPERAQRLGAAAYMIKPVSRQQLQAVLPLLASSTDMRRIVMVPSALNPRLAIGDISSGQPVQQPTAVPAQRTVLLVEDNELSILTITDYLQVAGYSVVVARTGEEAIKQAHATQPVIVLMDIHLPGMDGLEAIQHLRTNPQTASVPIIALTALAMPGDRKRCLAVGADDYLSKPVSLQALVHTIETLSGHSPVMEAPLSL